MLIAALLLNVQTSLAGTLDLQSQAGIASGGTAMLNLRITVRWVAEERG